MSGKVLFAPSQKSLPGLYVIFEGSYEGLNNDQYFYIFMPIKGSSSDQHWLKRQVNALTKAEHDDYITNIVKSILNFL